MMKEMIPFFDGPESVYYKILRSAIWKENLDNLNLTEQIQWQKILQNYEDQGLLPLVSPVLMSDQIVSYLSPQQQYDILSRVADNVQLHYRVRNVYTKISAALEKKGVMPILVKGEELAERYTQPNLRAVGDIDLFLFPQNAETAIDIIKTIGGHYLGNSGRHHKFILDEIEIELHHHLICSSKDKREGINLYTESAITNPMKEAYPGIRTLDKTRINARVLPVYSELLYNLAHIAKHIQKGELGLRQFVDMALLVRESVEKVDFERFQRDLYDLSLGRIWDMVAWFIGKYLGVSSPRIIFHVPSGRVQNLFLRLVVNNGNFGKTGGRDRHYLCFKLFPRYSLIRLFDKSTVFFNYVLFPVRNPDRVKEKFDEFLRK